jgi:hypothetical protein
VSHHFDSPTAIEDGRLNLCDVYVFPSPGATSTVILTVNPDAGRSSPTTLRPDALYELVVASDAGTVEDRALRVLVGAPDGDGRQSVAVRYAEGPSSRTGADGSTLGEGHTGNTFPLVDGGRAWVGAATDPFWGDGPALFRFHQGISAGEYRPEEFSEPPTDVFHRRNVTAIALQLPNTRFGSDHVTIWARISLTGHAPQRVVSRMGNPMLRPLFFAAPGAETEALNAGLPADDVTRYSDRVREIAARVAVLRGLADPERHAVAVAGAFLPDVIHFRPEQPAVFMPGTGNGRALHDDAFGTALSVLNGGTLGVTRSPRPMISQFPYLAAPDQDELPALLDLFGLRARPDEAA